jgi:hypothetical protein
VTLKKSKKSVRQAKIKSFIYRNDTSLLKRRKLAPFRLIDKKLKGQNNAYSEELLSSRDNVSNDNCCAERIDDVLVVGMQG